MLKTCSKCSEEKDISLFYKGMGRCKLCHRAQVYDWKRRNPEKTKQIQEKWRAIPGNRAKEVAATRRWQQNNPELFKRNNLKHSLKKLYGLSLEDYDRMKKAQNDLCAICRKNLPLDVDHNHTTGMVRALLCQNCNRGIGIFFEDTNLLTSAITYLTKHQPPSPPGDSQQ